MYVLVGSFKGIMYNFIIDQYDHLYNLSIFISLLFNFQSGCCKPPLTCGFEYSNPTTWVGLPNLAAGTDCTLWNNDLSQLCYNCNSCKAGLLGNLREEWKKTNIVLIITVVVLIWVYLIACSAYRNAQTEQLFRRYKQGWVWEFDHKKKKIKKNLIFRIWYFVRKFF